LIDDLVKWCSLTKPYLTSAPILTVNWKADSGQQWTVPLGGGVGKIFHLGKLPVNTQIARLPHDGSPR
jgi:hypothetical protein